MFVSSRATGKVPAREDMENEQRFRCHFKGGGQRSWLIRGMYEKEREREGMLFWIKMSLEEGSEDR